MVDPKAGDKTEAYISLLVELRKAKGMTPEQARGAVTGDLYYGALMVKTGDADGMVAGAINSTGNVLRPALQIIKTAPGISVVSGAFIMEVPSTAYGDEGVLIFGDCAVLPNPDADQLAAIAIASAQTGKQLTGMDPKVAMLSFPQGQRGTRAGHQGAGGDQKGARAGARPRVRRRAAGGRRAGGERRPAEIARLRPVAGHANVLIFPDLQAGNIGYKLVQRLAGASAVGPIVQGLAKPVNDLSRGCSVEDIVSVVAIAAVKAQA